MDALANPAQSLAPSKGYIALSPGSTETESGC
jgi:hypothetical protein